MKNMSRFSKLLAAGAAFFMMASCGPKAVIEGVMESASSSEVIVRLLDANRYKTLDTVAVNASGRFSYKLDMEEGQPEFIYLFQGDKKLAGLLLEAGDKVKVAVDSLGQVDVEGSEESVKLAQVENDYAAFLRSYNAAGELTLQDYVTYYRDRVKYVMQNSKSLTAVHVLYQNVAEGLPLFAQNTDAIFFSNVADSLETVYPDSRYVKSLRKEAERRYSYMKLQERLDNAQEVGYIDIALPDVNAKEQRLSEVDSKVVMIYFWTASEPAQNIFNVEVLKPLYADYHKKGFEIYQVSLDIDKSLWATAVKGQDLPWINVCDSRGSASPYVAAYNLPTLPAAFVLSNGELVDGQIVDEKALRKLLNGLLK